MSRFDYVRYDDLAQSSQEYAKGLVQRVENFINGMAVVKEHDDVSKRETALALEKLEECYMWIGKGIRNIQIARNGSAPLQEERVSS